VVDCELPYPSDLMAAQWAMIEPLLQQRNPKDKAERPSSRAFQGITFEPVGTGVRWSEVPGVPCDRF
jgi:hypothetical protein